MSPIFPINPKAAFGLWCALMLDASGHDTILNSGDRLEAETAARLREMDKSGNRPDPHRPMSPEMQAVKPSQIENLNAEDLAKMALDNPLLKRSYANVFLDCMGPFEQLEPQQELVLADMRRRGEAVSPMFLKLIEENRETRIESAVLGNIKNLGTVRLEPFLEYARKLLRERLRSDVVAEASGLLAGCGTKRDIELFEWVLTQRPFAVTDLTKNLKILRVRLDSPPVSRSERREIPSKDVGSVARPTKSVENHQRDGTDGTSRIKPWLIGGLILVVLLSVCRLLFRGQRETSA